MIRVKMETRINNLSELDSIARQMGMDAKDQIHYPEITIKVYPATKGGWKVGYLFNGNYKVVIEPVIHIYAGDKSYIIKGYVKSVKDILALWDKQKDRLIIAMDGKRYVELYRRSGLIPNHITKKHSNKMKNLFGNDYLYTNKDSHLVLNKLAYGYIRKYSICPFCQSKGMEEVVFGIVCPNCKAYWDDMVNHKWYDINNKEKLGVKYDRFS